jgi:cytochrome c biogenesis protein CcmG, thiol:disulfide interchange protein DsbE
VTALAPTLSRGRGRAVLWTVVAIGLVAALLVGVLATRDAALTRQVDSPLLGRPAPVVAGTTLQGRRFSLAGERGRWVLVNFFATWCVPCRDEHPELARFAERHRDAADAGVVSVVYSDERGRVRSFFREEGGDWPVVDDPDGRVALDWGVGKVPESYLVDPRGVVVAKIVGGVEEPGLERILATARRRAR